MAGEGQVTSIRVPTGALGPCLDWVVRVAILGFMDLGRKGLITGASGCPRVVSGIAVSRWNFSRVHHLILGHAYPGVSPVAQQYPCGSVVKN